MLLQWILTLCLISFASTAVIDARSYSIRKNEPSEFIPIIEPSPVVLSSVIQAAFEGNESVNQQKSFDLPLRIVRSALYRPSEDFKSSASVASSDSSSASAAASDSSAASYEDFAKSINSDDSSHSSSASASDAAYSAAAASSA